MTTSGTESNAAVATPVAALVMPGPTWRSDHAWLPARPRIAVGGMRRDLLMSRRDEAGCTQSLKRSQQGDVRVTAQAEHAVHAALAQEARDVVGNGRFHGPSPCGNLGTLSPCRTGLSST